MKSKIIKYKTVKKKSKRNQSGGAAAVASSLKTNHNVQHTFKLKDIIQSKTITPIIIKFKGIKFYCKLGNNNLLIGKDEITSCILLRYFFLYSYCILESFFNGITKLTCISNKSINNTNFNYNSKNNNGYTLNKKFNKTLLELIDIVNINCKILFCKLTDTSIKLTDKCTIPLYKLKIIERGYSFYNEFGYVFRSNDNKNHNEYIVFSNEILQTQIPLIQETKFNKLIEDFYKKYIKIMPNDEYFIDIIKKISILKETYAFISNMSFRELVIELLKYCKNKDTIINQINKDNIIILFEILENLYIGYSAFQKLYQYDDSENVKISKLLDKDSDEQRHFAMVEFPNYKLKIINSELDDREMQIEISL